MEIIKGGVTAAKGFQAAAAAAEIKYQGRTDMALIYSEKPCRTAGTFTTNVVKAAPVKWDKCVVESKVRSQAVIVNSGIANACTGAEGMEYCRETAEEAAKILGIDAKGVLIGSTGVIGMQLPIDRIKAGIAKLAEGRSADLESGTEAAKAIMTTDTRKKEAAVRLEIGGKTVTIGLSIPTAQYLVALAQLFHISTDYLLGLQRTETLYLDGLKEKEKQLLYDMYHYFTEKDTN